MRLQYLVGYTMRVQKYFTRWSAFRLLNTMWPFKIPIEDTAEEIL